MNILESIQYLLESEQNKKDNAMHHAITGAVAGGAIGSGYGAFRGMKEKRDSLHDSIVNNLRKPVDPNERTTVLNGFKSQADTDHDSFNKEIDDHAVKIARKFGVGGVVLGGTAAYLAKKLHSNLTNKSK